MSDLKVFHCRECYRVYLGDQMTPTNRRSRGYIGPKGKRSLHARHGMREKDKRPVYICLNCHTTRVK